MKTLNKLFPEGIVELILDYANENKKNFDMVIEKLNIDTIHARFDYVVINDTSYGIDRVGIVRFNMALRQTHGDMYSVPSLYNINTKRWRKCGLTSKDIISIEYEQDNNRILDDIDIDWSICFIYELEPTHKYLKKHKNLVSE